VSDHAAIRAVSEGLKGLLQDHLSASVGSVSVDLRSPKDVGAANATKQVSLWLYRVTRSDFLTNDPPPRPAPDLISRWPIPVNLCYLVTPIHQDAATLQEMLGVILQTFNDHAQLSPSDLGSPASLAGQTLRLTVEPLALEELTHIWHALHESYQLSLAYQLQYVSIDSAHGPDRGEPVLDRRLGAWQTLGRSQS
jgi:hypothetical protein